MNWKQFLKPTRKNIIWAIIFFVIISFLPIVPYYCVYRCLGCEGIEYSPIIAGCEFITVTYIAIFIELILSYLLSCWLIRLFSRK